MKKFKTGKGLLGILLVLLMICLLIPAGVMADDFYQDDNGVYHIASLTGLKAFRDQANTAALNGQNSGVDGHTKVVLDTDIDLNNEEWTPINGSCINFDGQNHTIKNVKVTGDDKNVGLFGAFSICEISNLTIDGADVTGINHVAALCGDGLCTVIDKCTVKNAVVTTKVYNNDDGDKAGAICGYLSGESTASVKNCTAEDCVITGYRDIGGLVGYANGTAVVQNNTVKKTTVCCDNKNNANYKNYTKGAEFDIHEVVGEAATAATVSDNAYENVKVVFTDAAAQIGDNTYLTLADALAAVPADNTTLVTIELLKDIQLPYSSANYSLDVNKNNVKIQGNERTISPIESSQWDSYKVDGTNKKYGSYNLVTVSGTNVTLDNMTIDVGEYRGMSCATTKGGTNVTYDHVAMTGRGSGHYYGYGAGGGTITFNNCIITTTGYGIHFSQESQTQDKVVIQNCKVYGWNSFGTCESVTVTDTYFGAANDEGINGILAEFRPYCTATLTNCTFAKEYTQGDDYNYVGLGTGAAVEVDLTNCSVEDGSNIVSIINYKNAFNDNTAKDGSWFVIDDVKDEQDVYYSGICVTRNDDILDRIQPLGTGCTIVTVQNKTEESPYIHIIGKNAAADNTNYKITAGSFMMHVGKYIDNTNYEVVYGDQEYPFKVQAKVVPGQKTVNDIPIENPVPAVEVSSAIQQKSEADQLVVETALGHIEVTGVLDALNTEKKDDLLAAAKKVEGSSITQEKINSATEIVYEITAKAVATECDEPTTSTGTLLFEVKPMANITTYKDGDVTGQANDVPIDNSYLNGQTITVTVGCGNIVPVQIVHTADDGSAELFTKGDAASYANKTFMYDETDKTATVEITHFSNLAVLGQELYANVIFNANGGTGTMDAQAVLKGTDYTLPECTFTREGYTFAGWSLTPNGEAVKTISVSDTTTVYALWKSTSPNTGLTGSNTTLVLVGALVLAAIGVGFVALRKRTEN